MASRIRRTADLLRSGGTQDGEGDGAGDTDGADVGADDVEGAAEPEAAGEAEPEAAGDVLGPALTAGDGEGVGLLVKKPP
jgi:hypothetical protein